CCRTAAGSPAPAGPTTSPRPWTAWWSRPPRPAATCRGWPTSPVRAGGSGTWSASSGASPAPEPATRSSCPAGWRRRPGGAAPRRTCPPGPRLAHLPRPGRRVRDVVSQFGRFTRTGAGDAFELTSWLAPVPGRGRTEADLPDGPEAAVRDLTGWDFPDGSTGVSAFLHDEKAVTTEELALLRTMDPEGCYR